MRILKLFAPLLLAFVALCVALPSAWAEDILGHVTEWKTGSSFTFSPTGGEDIQVRLWAVDAPELGQDGYQQALNITRGKIGLGRSVRLEKLGEDRDGVVIARVNGIISAADLLSSGYFWLYGQDLSIRPQGEDTSQLRNAFSKVQKDRKGIFSVDNPVSPSQWRNKHKTTTPTKK